uniref:Protein C10 n=1 Tax=Salmo trutta TaxID=8032 RepID=A0A673VVZ2_SALTR
EWTAPAQSLQTACVAVVLSEVIQAFSVPENSARMEEARESAYNMGVLKFARLVKMYETQDPQIAAISVKLGSLLLPPLSTPPIGGAIPAS